MDLRTVILDSTPLRSGKFPLILEIHSLTVKSEDGKTWGASVAVGSYIDDASLKATTFTPANARYVNITALSEAGNRGPWTSIAEVNVYTGGTPAPAPAPAIFGSWGLTIDFPLVPVSASIEVASGRLLVWSSWIPSDFHGTNGQTTITASYDLVTQLVSEAVITNVGHDMFCEGLSIDFSGKIVAVGGNSDYATSLYDSVSNSWARGGVSLFMSIPMVLNFIDYPVDDDTWHLMLSDLLHTFHATYSTWR